MSDFLKSSPAIDQIAANSTSFEQLREEMKAQLVRDGAIDRDPETQGYGVRLLRQPESEPDVALSGNPAQDTCMRVIYPAGNNRFEIYGASEQELDQKEQQIRNMFGGQR